MTEFAEVIYETGAKSVVSYENEDDLKAGLFEHQRRAISGENAQEGLDRPAERVKKVYLYSAHPVDLVSTDVNSSKVSSLVSGMTNDKGELDSNQLIAALRDEASPIVLPDAGRHESIFKASADGELDLAFMKKLEQDEGEI